MTRLKRTMILTTMMLLALSAENPIPIDLAPQLPSAAFLYKHGYEFVGKPVKADPRMKLLVFTDSNGRAIGSSFYTRHRQYTAQHVSDDMGGFTRIGESDVAWRVAMPKAYFEINPAPLAYRGTVIAYGYVDGVLREYKGKMLGILPVSTGSEIIVDFRVRGGASGGVLLDDKGLVLGVISATTMVDGNRVTMVIPIRR